MLRNNPPNPSPWGEAMVGALRPYQWRRSLGLVGRITAELRAAGASALTVSPAWGWNQNLKCAPRRGCPAVLLLPVCFSSPRGASSGASVLPLASLLRQVGVCVRGGGTANKDPHCCSKRRFIKKPVREAAAVGPCREHGSLRATALWCPCWCQSAERVSCFALLPFCQVNV